MSVGNGEDGELPRGFAETLAALKREGCSFLVVGDVPPSAHATAFEQFFHERSEGRRVVLATDDTFLPGPTADSDTTVVRYEGELRAAAADAAEVTPDRSDASDLEGLGTAALEAIEAFEATTASPAPGRLRLAVGTVAPLLAEYGTEDVFSFLHLLTGRVNQCRGMAFVHLPVDREDESALTLEPLFDGVVELSVEDGRYGQRWHLDSFSTDWFDL
jgi:hypothetical protein